MTRVLITGAQGFLGRYLVADWLTADSSASVLGVGRSPRSNEHFMHHVHWRGRPTPAPLPEALCDAAQHPRYRYETTDVLDQAAFTRLLGEFRPDHVVHLAASLRDDPPVQLVANNIGTVASLVEALGAAGLGETRTLFGSSGAVYGLAANERLPVDESARCSPVDPYAVSKKAGEDLGRVLCDNHRLAATWARIFNPVGAGQDERHLCGWLACQIAPSTQSKERPVVTIGSLDTTRDYIDARDTAQALRLVATQGAGGEVYNVATGIETAGEDVLSGLLAAARLEGGVEIKRTSARANDLPRAYADIGKLSGLGFRQEYELADSLGDLMAYYVDAVASAATAG